MIGNVLMSALRIGVAAYLGLTLLVLLRQSSYVYYPDRAVSLTPAALGMAFESVALRTEDGETLSAWYVPAGKPPLREPAPALLYCHGNAGDIGDRVYSVKTFHDMGLDVLVFDYRGYGESSGRPSEKGTYADASAAWQWLSGEKGFAASNVVVFGRSMGGAVAAELARRVRPGVLALDSTFTSAPDMARRMFPYLPVGLLCRYRYDALRHVREAGCPVIVSHSANDEMVPFAHGQRLYDAAAQPKLLIRFRGGHNDMGLDADAGSRAQFRDFLVRHMP